MYVCGPTVYDVAHLGHGRHLLVFDVMRRYLEWSGYEVHYVSNVTDIEDKIIAKAKAAGISAEEVVATYESQWWSLVERLGCRRPDDVPHATDYVAQMVNFIADLIDRDMAYVTDDGVYFSVDALEGYGLLARQSLDSMRAGGGDRAIVGEAGKHHPFDFALWKKIKEEGEPAWASPWHVGRPGWHIECTVMALDLLGEHFDLHGGGHDLAFPHHENERAQALGAGKGFARHWLHHGMVLAKGGEEMHRSANNFVSLADLVERHDPRAYRLLVLQSHYRGPMEVQDENIEAAERTIAGLDNFARRVGALDESVEPDPDVIIAFRTAMDEDFNSPPALAGIFDAMRRANVALDRGKREQAESLAAAVLELATMLGLPPRESDTVDDASSALAADRDAARSAKDWARADAIRAELEGQGWTVQDGPHGTQLTR